MYDPKKIMAGILLSYLIVNEKTGKHGEGLTEIVGDINVERENVFKYNWFGLYPPSEKQFDEAWRKAK
ncbi:MAG TPA: hypothetical protein VMW20_06980 [Candidatus Nanoarchaeia archaeon]|nr:hypothetical protein [Candidatus Nanoarchaeia archaeon]